MLVDFSAGVFDGLCSVVGNNPVDVVKTKMQSEHAHKFNGFIHCAKEIYRHDGFKGYYHGVGPRLVRVCRLPRFHRAVCATGFAQ